MPRDCFKAAASLSATLMLFVFDAAADPSRPAPTPGREMAPESTPPKEPKVPSAPARPKTREGEAREPEQPACPYFEGKLELIV